MPDDGDAVNNGSVSAVMNEVISGGVYVSTFVAELNDKLPEARGTVLFCTNKELFCCTLPLVVTVVGTHLPPVAL